MDDALNALREFLRKHKRTANLALLLDSKVYESSGDNRAPSGQPQWSMELLKAGATSAPELALAIQRLNREVARVLGTENILLGESGAGSLAMAEDKSAQFALIIDSTLKELAETFNRDLVRPFMELNGWDPKLAPKLRPEKIQHSSVAEVTAALKDLASAGAVMGPDDPAINQVRARLGLEEIDLEKAAEDAAINADLERKAAEAELAMTGAKTHATLNPKPKPTAPKE
jgi:phage gp29-like protein